MTKTGHCDVGLLLRSAHEHQRQIAMGAVEYQRINPAFRIVGDGYRPLLDWSALSTFRGDGLLAIVEDEIELERLHHCGIPFVLCGARIIKGDLKVVASDNFAVGEMAAEHLMANGIKRFLFAGVWRWDDEKLRLDGFRQTLMKAKLECDVCEFEGQVVNGSGSTTDVSVIATMLQHARQYPVGVFCPNALAARAVVHACRQAELQVPDQVAVVAVNNDPIHCETLTPPLSSIVQRSKQIGFVAARKMHDCLMGSRRESKQTFLNPQRLSVRRSSDLLMVGDAQVEAAWRFIRDHAAADIDVQDVVNHVNVSRRTLEIRFRETLQSTPRQLLLKMRLDLATALLTESELSISQIALRSGFASSQVFSTVFKKNVGVTPTRFRMRAGEIDWDSV